jgi:hypothetical protein
MSIIKDTIYFYYPGKVPDEINLRRGLDCWILKTYRILSKTIQRHDIRLTTEIPDEGIIIFHKGFFPEGILPNKRQYFVCVQADYGRYALAQYHIQQNPAAIGNFRFSQKAAIEQYFFPFVKNRFIPIWNQDNIIARNANRGNRFENLVFMGIEKNFPPEFLNADFKHKIAALGLDLKIVNQVDLWNDYSEADVVLAIRDVRLVPHYNKPFSKIINAYIAGVPVIAGYESSALYLKNKNKISLDIVKDEQSLLDALKHIKNNYAEALQNAADNNLSLLQYHDKGILVYWDETFQEIKNCFKIWNKCGNLYRNLFARFSRL